MTAKDAKDPMEELEWKNMSNQTKGTASTSVTAGKIGEEVVKKRPRTKFREIPEYYFLPKKSIPAGIAFYGSFIAAGIGAGMLLEIWIKKRIKEDGDGGGIIWEFR